MSGVDDQRVRLDLEPALVSVQIAVVYKLASRQMSV